MEIDRLFDKVEHHQPLTETERAALDEYLTEIENGHEPKPSKDRAAAAAILRATLKAQYMAT